MKKSRNPEKKNPQESKETLPQENLEQIARKRNMGKHHVVVIPPNDKDSGKQVDPRIVEFDTKSDLNEWLNVNEVKPHSKGHLRGQRFLCKPDGSTVLAFYGKPLILRSKVYA